MLCNVARRPSVLNRYWIDGPSLLESSESDRSCMRSLAISPSSRMATPKIFSTLLAYLMGINPQKFQRWSNIEFFPLTIFIDSTFLLISWVCINRLSTVPSWSFKRVTRFFAFASTLSSVNEDDIVKLQYIIQQLTALKPVLDSQTAQTAAKLNKNLDSLQWEGVICGSIPRNSSDLRWFKDYIMLICG